EIASLEKKSDESLTLHYKEVFAACEESVKRHAAENDSNANSATPTAVDATVELAGITGGSADVDTPVSSPKDVLEAASRESSVEPNDANENGDVVPYDKARRSLKRIDQMNTIREKVLTHPELDLILTKARKTSGLPSWWEVPKHDKALLEGICKHGVGRHDLIIEDPELPFYHVKQSFIQGTEEAQSLEEEADSSKFVWPRDLVIARRIDSLCDLVLNPKPFTIRQTRKRKTGTDTVEGSPIKKVFREGDGNLSEEYEYEGDADEEDEEGNVLSNAADDIPEREEYYQQTQFTSPSAAMMNDVVHQNEGYMPSQAVPWDQPYGQPYGQPAQPYGQPIAQRMGQPIGQHIEAEQNMYSEGGDAVIRSEQ
ncbi:choline dehydrogenase 7, partial [Rhizopus stolonifer]